MKPGAESTARTIPLQARKDKDPLSKNRLMHEHQRPLDQVSIMTEKTPRLASSTHLSKNRDEYRDRRTERLVGQGVER